MFTVKRRDNLLIDLFGKFLGFDFGVFTLNHGKHEIFVPTKICPDSVWTKIIDIRSEACCQRTINDIGYKVCDKGISFTIHVKTEQAVIEWFAVS